MPNDIKTLPRICAYCGTAENLTTEHVIQRSLEAPDAPQWQSVIVWACTKCNGLKSALDTKIRDLLAVDIIGGNHPTAQKLMASKVKRSVDRAGEMGHKHHLLELMKASKPDQIVGADGKVIAAGMGGTLKEDYFSQWFRYVIQGLTMALSDEYFPPEFEIKVDRFYPDAIEAIRKLFEQMQMPDPVSLGTHTMFSHKETSDMPFGCGLWAFQFYGGVIFFVYVAPEGFDWAETEEV